MEGAGEMKKGGRRTMDTRVSKNKNICIVRWQDNNMVNIASLFVGIVDKDALEQQEEKVDRG